MDHALEHAAIRQQFFQDGQRLFQVPVQRAVDAALAHHRFADHRVAAYLAPVGRFFVLPGGDRQIAQVEIGAEIAQRAGLRVHRLQRGERWPAADQADVGVRQQEAPARDRFFHVGALRAVAPEVAGHQPGVAHVVANLHAVVADAVQVGAIGDFRVACEQLRIQLVAVVPERGALGGQPRQRLPQHVGELFALQVDAVFPG